MPYPKVARAAVLHAYGEELQVEEIPVPTLEPRAALIAVEVSTVCGTDVHILDGHIARVSSLPVLLGHEAAGRIVALGPQRTHDAVGAELHEGDLVVWSYSWCGHCYWCTIAKQPTLCPGMRPYGWGPTTRFPHLIGGFAQYVYVMENSAILKVPAGLDPRIVSPSTCALRTVVHGYERIGQIEPHETAVVQGAGAVGLFAVAFAAQLGLKSIICIGAPDSRLEIAKALGADTVLNVEQTDAEARRDAVLEATEGRGADLVVECSGAPPALGEGIGLLRRGGRYLVIGPAGARSIEFLPTLINTRQISLVGSLGGDISHYYRALRFLSGLADKSHIAKIVGGDYPLERANEAIESVRTAREIRPVIVP